MGATYESPLACPPQEGDEPFPSGFWNLRPQPAMREACRHHMLWVWWLWVTQLPLATLHSTAKPQVSSTAVSSFS